MDNDVNKKSTGTYKIIIFLLVLLLFGAIGFICYDKFINTEKPPIPNNEDTTNTPTPNNEEKENIVIVDKITKFERTEVVDTDKAITIGDKEYKVRKETTVDGAYLLIDDAVRERGDFETAYADFVYVTNYFAIFTTVAQDGEVLSYAIDQNGNRIITNDNEYQMNNIKLSDGIITANGHIFCGLDGDCPDKELIILYADNTITVKPKQ